jgi:hypothetical protein
MRIYDPFGRFSQQRIPISLKFLVILISFKVFERFQITHDESAVIKKDRDTIFAVTRGRYNLSFDPELL